MKMKKNLVLFTLALLALTLTSCNDKNQGKDPQEQKITLDVAPTELHLKMGKTEKLVILVSPKETPVSAVSSDSKIATVSNDGLVTAIAVGECTISVKAGDIIKTTKVIVSEPSKIDESRFIGIKGNEIAPCVYIPKQKEMVNSLEILKEANALYNWVYRAQTPEEEEKNGFGFDAPMQGKNYADKRLVFFIQYQPALKTVGKIPRIYFSTRIQDTSDPFEKDEHKQAMETLAKAYGFNEGLQYSKLKDGNPCLIAYNYSLGENEPLEAKFYSEKTTDGKNIGIVMQIAYRGPENN